MTGLDVVAGALGDGVTSTMGRLLVPVVLVLSACSGSPTAPTSIPASPPITVQLIETLTGVSIGSHHITATLPARLTLSAPGYFDRQTLVSHSGQTVDLIRDDSQFNLAFYRQIARGTLEHTAQPLLVLDHDPSFYLEVEGTKGVAPHVGEQLEAVAREVVDALTGGRRRVARWETGPTPRSRQNGWIVIETADLSGDLCGWALIGVGAGHIQLDWDAAGASVIKCW